MDDCYDGNRIFDVEAAYTFSDRYTIAVGADNVLDEEGEFDKNNLVADGSIGTIDSGNMYTDTTPWASTAASGTCVSRPTSNNKNVSQETPHAARHQRPGRPGRTERREGEAESAPGRDEAAPARHDREGAGGASLMEQALARENVVIAWKRVKANKGSAGVDDLSITDTIEHLKSH